MDDCKGGQSSSQIIQAVSSKLTFDPSVDFEMIASETEGLSGADLQAVVYNAHLDVVQASLAAEAEMAETGRQGKGKGKGGESNHRVSDGKQSLPTRKAWKQIAPDDGKRDDMSELNARVGLHVAMRTMLISDRGDFG